MSSKIMRQLEAEARAARAVELAPAAVVYTPETLDTAAREADSAGFYFVDVTGSYVYFYNPASEPPAQGKVV